MSKARTAPPESEEKTAPVTPKARTLRKPPGETREQAGVRLSLHRMRKLERVFHQIGNLGNYPLPDKKVDKICDTMKSWANQTEVLLRNHRPETTTFNFD